MDGFLNLDKPAGMTSRQVVNHVGRLVEGRKIGHAGTLDPLATGVLVLAIGRATRLVSYVQQMAKSYRATLQLGHTSETDDLEGPLQPVAGAVAPDERTVRQTLAGWVGHVPQTPPAYSAVKVAGRRAYRLARRGRVPQLASRLVDIYRLELVHYAYPRLVLDLQCGAGTYVRSLARDLGRQLGTGAVLAQLARLAVGRFTLPQAVPLNTIDENSAAAALQPLRVAVEHLPRVELTAEQRRRIVHGLTIEAGGVAGAAIAAVDHGGQLVAILGPRSPGQLGPIRVLGDA